LVINLIRRQAAGRKGFQHSLIHESVENLVLSLKPIVNIMAILFAAELVKLIRSLLDSVVE
jgi:hypothetical protein